MSQCRGDYCPIADENYLEIWDSFNKLRLKKQLCDVTLLCSDGQSFPAHKAILAANSPYFRALFTNGMKETGEKEIRMQDISSRSLEVLLDYIYTRSARITIENVKTIFSVADGFLVTGLAEQCVHFLQSALSPNNCIGIMKFASAYNRPDLAAECKSYVLSNFSELAVKSSELLQLEAGELLEILSDDLLNVKSEEEVFEVAVRWINFWSEQRSGFMPRFLRHIRLGLVQADYFMQSIASHPLVLKHSEECDPIVRIAWEYLYNTESYGSKSVDHNNPIIRPRVPHSVVFVIGGWSGGSPTLSIETYDQHADRWFEQDCVEDITPRAYHGMVELNGYIYVIGGFDGTQYYNSIRRLNLNTKKWCSVSPMYYQRCYVSAVAAGGFIYACGGYDGRQRLQSAERFDPEHNQWKKLADMACRRSDAGCEEVQGKLNQMMLYTYNIMPSHILFGAVHLLQN